MSREEIGRAVVPADRGRLPPDTELCGRSAGYVCPRVVDARAELERAKITEAKLRRALAMQRNTIERCSAHRDTLAEALDNVVNGEPLEIVEDMEFARELLLKPWVRLKAKAA